MISELNHDASLSMQVVLVWKKMPQDVSHMISSLPEEAKIVLEVSGAIRQDHNVAKVHVREPMFDLADRRRRV